MLLCPSNWLTCVIGMLTFNAFIANECLALWKVNVKPRASPTTLISRQGNSDRGWINKNRKNGGYLSCAFDRAFLYLLAHVFLRGFTILILRDRGWMDAGFTDWRVLRKEASHLLQGIYL